MVNFVDVHSIGVFFYVIKKGCQVYWFSVFWVLFVQLIMSRSV